MINYRIKAVALKEIRHVIRDPRSLYMALAMPIIFLFLFGYAISLDVEHVEMGVCNQDNTPASRELLRTFIASRYFEIRYSVTDPEGLSDLLDRAKIRVGLLIPPGFGKNVKRMESPSVQVLIDGTEANSANVIIGYVKGISALYSSRLAVSAMNQQGLPFKEQAGVEAISRIMFNPELKSRNFIVPGLIALIMAIVMSILSALTIAREREKGTLEQLIVTPVKPYELMIGKMVPYWLIGMVDMLLVVCVGVFVFQVPLRGSIVLLFITTGIFAFSTLGVGLLISVSAESQQLATQLALIIGLLPNFILSGFMFPVKSMPLFLRLITKVIPAKYFLVILRGIFLKGNGILILGGEIITLTIFGAILIFAASTRFKKKMS